MTKPHSCRECYFYDKIIHDCLNSDNGSCLWFEKYKGIKGGKPIPSHIISRGCNLYTTKIVGYILEKFDGELI